MAADCGAVRSSRQTAPAAVPAAPSSGTANGTMFPEGAPRLGTMSGTRLNEPIVGFALS